MGSGMLGRQGCYGVRDIRGSGLGILPAREMTWPRGTFVCLSLSPRCLLFLHEKREGLHARLGTNERARWVSHASGLYCDKLRFAIRGYLSSSVALVWAFFPLMRRMLCSRSDLVQSEWERWLRESRLVSSRAGDSIQMPVGWGQYLSHLCHGISIS